MSEAARVRDAASEEHDRLANLFDNAFAAVQQAEFMAESFPGPSTEADLATKKRRLEEASMHLRKHEGRL